MLRARTWRDARARSRSRSGEERLPVDIKDTIGRGYISSNKKYYVQVTLYIHLRVVAKWSDGGFSLFFGPTRGCLSLWVMT